MGCFCDNRHALWQWRMMMIAWFSTLPRSVLDNIAEFLGGRGWENAREHDLEALIG